MRILLELLSYGDMLLKKYFHFDNQKVLIRLLKSKYLLEQIISTSANFLIAILMIRQLDINYIGKAQVFLIPYATLNAFLTTKYYLLLHR